MELILALISAALIFFRSGDIPRNLSYDEVAFTNLALNLKNHSPTIYSPLATGHTTPYFYIILLCFNVFGIHNWVLRLPAALFGIATVLMTYLVMKRLFRGIWLPFALALMLLTMRWYLTFARFSFEATFLLFLEVTSIYFLLRSVEERRMRFTVAGAVFSSLAFYSYTPGRLFPFVASLFGFMHTKRKAFITQLIVTAAMVIPLVVFLSFNTDTRIGQVSLISNRSLSGTQKIAALGDNTLKAAGMFLLNGDMNGRHNYPGKAALNPVLALLFISGLGIACLRMKKGYNGFFVSYFLAALIPMILTNPADNPNMLRSISVLPSLVYFMGVSLQEIISRAPRRHHRIAVAVLTCLLLLSAAYEMRTYFLFQSRVMRNSFEVTCTLDELASTGYAHVPKHCGVKKNEF